MHKPLSREATEQAVHYPLVKVELDHLFGDHCRVLEDHRANGRAAAPFQELLVFGSRSAEAIHGVGPGRVRAGALIDRRKDVSVRSPSAAVARVL